MICVDLPPDAYIALEVDRYDKPDVEIHFHSEKRSLYLVDENGCVIFELPNVKKLECDNCRQLYYDRLRN